MAAVLDAWMLADPEDASVFQLRSSLVKCGEKLLADKLFPLEGTEDEVLEVLEVLEAAKKPLTTSEVVESVGKMTLEDVTKYLYELKEMGKVELRQELPVVWIVHKESAESSDAAIEPEEYSIHSEVRERHIETVANQIGDAWELVARSLKPVVDESTLRSHGSQKSLSSRCKIKAVLSAWKGKHSKAASVFRLYQALIVNGKRSVADQIVSLQEGQDGSLSSEIDECFAFEEDDLAYRMRDFLDAGRFSQVYRATVMNIVVAAKIAFKEQHDTRDLIEREAKLYLRIGGHPNIVSFIGICRCPTFSALLLEHFPGDLSSLLQSRDDPDVELLDNRLDIARQIARGMVHLHTIPVCRIDLKPANVLVRRRRGPFRFLCKICDFNMAVHNKMSEAELSQYCLSGTRGYIAPEEFTSDSCEMEFLKKCDIWSFGVVLLDIGKRQHWEDFPKYEGIIPIFRKLTEHLEFNTIRCRCCAPNPKERPSFFEIQECLSSIIRANPDRLGLHGKNASVYREALQSGYAEATFIRINVVGKDRVGKTSLWKSLTRQKVNEQEPSTVGVRKCHIIVKETCNWMKCIEGEESLQVFDRMMASSIATQLKNKEIIDGNYLEETSGVSDYEQYPQLTDESLEVKPSSENTFDVPNLSLVTGLESTTATDNESERERGRVSRKLSEEDVVNRSSEDKNARVTTATSGKFATKSGSVYEKLPEEIKQLVEHFMEDEEAHEEAKKEKYIDAVDFGGQDVFYATHYLYLNKDAIYYAVFDASKQLWEDATSEICNNKGISVSINSPDGTTNYDRFEEWVSSIHVLDLPAPKASSEKPALTVFPIGTHKNQVSGDFLRQQTDYLLGHIRSKEDLFPHLVKEDVYYVDNVADPESEVFESIRSDTVNFAEDRSMAVPLRWLRFEKNVRKLKISLPYDKKIIPLSRLRKMAKECEIDKEEEFLAALQYLKNRAVIVHHPIPDSSAAEKVIMDPTWLTEVLQKVVTVRTANETPRELRNDVKRSKNKGIMSSQLLTHCLKDVEDSEVIVDLMKSFDLLCERVEKGDFSIRDFISIETTPLEDPQPATIFRKPKSYLVPCLLEKKEKLRPPSLNSGCPHLLLHSKSARIPLPLFYRILTTLSRRFPRFPRLHRNVAYFNVYSDHELEISCQRDCLRFTVHQPKSSQTRLRSDVCMAVRQYIVDEVMKAKEPGMAGLDLELMCEVSSDEKKELVSLKQYPSVKELYVDGQEGGQVDPPPRLPMWFTQVEKHSETASPSGVGPM